MPIAETIERIYHRRYGRIGLHLLFWIILFAVKLYLTCISFNVYRSFPVTGIVWLNIINTFLLAGVYYLFVYTIIPRLFTQKHYISGMLYTVLLVATYTVLDAFFEIQCIHQCTACMAALDQWNPAYAAYLNRGLINVTLTRLISLGGPVLLLFALCIPFSIKMMLQSFRTQLQSLQLAKDNLQLEFNFLSAQLNPHFLFNSMNNIYGLIISGNTQRSAALVARLSDLLRYTLYDSQQASVPLAREIQLIRDYIELEKVRLNDSQVQLDTQIDHDGYSVAPLLLMPLLENAFKYCGDTPESFIRICIQVQQAKLLCTIQNSIAPAFVRATAGGIGLRNFQKRMALYYPSRHRYTTQSTDNTYSLHLTIQL